MGLEDGPWVGAPAPEHPYTVRDVLGLLELGLLPRDRGELLFGELVVESPMGPLYRSLTVIVRQVLGLALGPGFHVQDHAPLVSGTYHMPQPAAAAIRGPVEAYSAVAAKRDGAPR